MVEKKWKFTLINLVHSTLSGIIVLEGDWDKVKMYVTNLRAACKTIKVV